MSDSSNQLLVACLWDLRAQLEQQIRLLTQVQRLASDRQISRPGTEREQLQRDIVLRMERARLSFQGTLSGLDECLDIARHLPPEG